MLSLKYIHPHLLLAGLAVFTFISCEKAHSVEPDSPDFDLPGEACNIEVVIEGDTLYTAGDRARIVPKITGNRTSPVYEWTWPDGTVTTGTSITIDEIGPEHEGTFSVMVQDGDNNCYAQSFLPVTVRDAIATCTPQRNSFELSGTPPITFDNVFCAQDHLTRNYIIRGDYSNNSLQIAFKQEEPPLAGKLYHIVEAESVEELGENDVTLTIQELSGNTMQATEGEVYVTLEEGELSVIFCDAKIPIDPFTTRTAIGMLSCP